MFGRPSKKTRLLNEIAAGNPGARIIIDGLISKFGIDGVQPWLENRDFPHSNLAPDDRVKWWQINYDRLFANAQTLGIIGSKPSIGNNPIEVTARNRNIFNKL